MTFILTKQLSNQSYLPVYMKLSVWIYYMSLLNVGWFSHTQLFVCLYLSQACLYMFNDNKVIIIIIINNSNLCLVFYLITFLYAIDVNFIFYSVMWVIKKKSWKSECVLSFNMGWRILDKILISANPC
jgi:hypothetical protein